MKQVSLTKRLVAVVISCQLLLTLGMTVMSVVYFRTQLRAAFDSSLLASATSTLAAVRYSESDPPGLLFDSSLLPPPSDPSHQDLFEIRGPGGQLVARSQGLQGLPSGLADPGPAYADFSLQGEPYRALALRNVGVLDNEESMNIPLRVTVMYAAPLAETYRHLTELAVSVAVTSLLLLLVASGAAFWGLHRGLAPLHELAESAGAISVRNWDFLPPPDATRTKELAPLTRAIQTVLSGLQESFRQQRDFTSDAAHELKTSVAILKSSLQSLLQRPRPEEEYRSGLDGLLEDCGRLEDLLERMLRLARIEQWTEAGGHREWSVTELSATCDAAICRMQSLADSRNVALELIDSAQVSLRADPEDLELIWVNLLENAVRYSPAGSKVVLRVQKPEISPNGGKTIATVSVEDCGPGIPSQDLPRVFERFHRGDPSRARSTGGFGLGLAICKALVTVYGGEIEVSNRSSHETASRPTDGLARGTVVHVTLPVEPS